MLATAARKLPTSSNLLLEPKWDGWRGILFTTDDGVLIQSRGGKPLSPYFPDIRRVAAPHIPPGTVLDGELLVWRVDTARTDFAALQQRVVAGRRLPRGGGRRPGPLRRLRHARR